VNATLKKVCIAQARKKHHNNIHPYTLKTYSNILLWIKLPKINQSP